MDRAVLHCALVGNLAQFAGGCLVSDWNVRCTNIHAIFGINVRLRCRLVHARDRFGGRISGGSQDRNPR
jgi:hypothetical protein